MLYLAAAALHKEMKMIKKKQEAQGVTKLAKTHVALNGRAVDSSVDSVLTDLEFV